MSSGRRLPPGQLEMPLVWELEPTPDGEETTDTAPRGHEHRPEPAGTLRLILAGLADLGGLMVLFAVAWVVAAIAGADPRSGGQLALVALLAIEAGSVAAIGLLWAWRASPGLLLLDVGFVKPLPASRVLRVWLCWMIGLPVAALPLLVGRAGHRPLERLGEAAISFRSPRGDA
jgi:hypothetical protein